MLHKKKLKDSVEVKVIKVFRLREIFMFFMLHLNEDFDDDLLLDTIRLLTDS